MHKLGNNSMTANDKRNEIKAYLRQGETFTMPVLHFWSATMYSRSGRKIYKDMV